MLQDMAANPINLTLLLREASLRRRGPAPVLNNIWARRRNYLRVLCGHSGRRFRQIRQLLPLIYMATAGGFPGIPIRNGRKERGVYLTQTYIWQL